MNSTDGPLEPRCPSGHFFSVPIEFLIYEWRACAKDGEIRMGVPSARLGEYT
jgi:hypothetical protein